MLDRLVAEAQQRNVDVRTAGLRILEARAQLGIAGSGLYPQLQRLSGEALRAGQQQSNGPGTAAWTYGIGLDIGWEIDFWGKFRRGIESADAAYFASIAAYDDTQVLVAAQAASFYASIRTGTFVQIGIWGPLFIFLGEFSELYEAIYPLGGQFRLARLR